jgi:MFS family permease
VAAAYGERLPRYPTYLVCFLLTGLPRFVLMGLDTPLWAVLAYAVVGGAASGFLNPILGAVIYERVPEHLLGRVSSLSSAACWALMPLGGLVGGFLVGGVGLSAAMLLCGLAYFAVTMLPAVDPRWREIDRRRDAEPVPATASS